MASLRSRLLLLSVCPLALPLAGCNDPSIATDDDDDSASATAGSITGATSTSSSGVVDSTVGPDDTTGGSTEAILTGDTTGSSTDATVGPDDTTGGSTTESTTSGTTDTGETTTGGVVEPPEAPVLDLSYSQVKQFDFTWPAATGAEYYQLLESAATGDPLVQLGSDIVGEAISITQSLHFRLTASYVLRACNMAGCTDSATVDVVGTLAEAVGYFKASNTDAGDLFGASVALSDDGSTLVIGATGESSNATGIDGDQANDAALNAGAVYVFVRDASDVWAQQAYVKASNTNASDGFGTSVALSADGNTLVVGAPYEASAAIGIGGNQASNTTLAAGAVYVFVRTGTDNWAQQAYVKASNTGFGDVFGYRVTVSDDGDTLAVAAYGESSSATGIGGNQANNTAFGAGAIYVFGRDPLDVWSQHVYIKATNTASGDGFGSSIAMSSDGNTLAVGAFGEDSSASGIGGDQADDAATQAGATYVLGRDGAGVWSHQAYIKASNPDAQDFFGWSVAMSGDGNTLVVGAYGEDGAATGIGGDETDDTAPDAGAVYVLVRDGAGVWTQQAYVKASNPDTQDYFGWSVATSGDGDVLAVAGYGEASVALGIGGDETDDTAAQAGATYVLVRDAMDAWSQRAYVKAPNTAATDTFGWTVATSGDGSILAVSGESEDSNATGLGGNQGNNATASSGAVYVY
jgi:hypothetical protein